MKELMLSPSSYGRRAKELLRKRAADADAGAILIRNESAPHFCP